VASAVLKRDFVFETRTGQKQTMYSFTFSSIVKKEKKAGANNGA